MEQAERIRQMEQRLDRASAAVIELSAALDKYEAAQEALKTLSDYYGSDEWKEDFAADEAGRLPQTLKRGNTKPPKLGGWGSEQAQTPSHV